MKTLLVIGGTGFFGKSILDYFSRVSLDRWEVERVLILSRNAEILRRETPELISSKVDLLTSDITKTEHLPGADIVIHAAASTDAARYVLCPLNERENIEAGVYNYCDLASKYHKTSKILYISSGAVYGVQPSSEHHVTEDNKHAELSDLPAGKRDYAYAKRAAEESIRQLGKHDYSVSIARCFAFVGPWLPRNQHFAIGNFIEDGISGKHVSVMARHKVYRSYMYADDLVEWLMTIACNSNPLCPTYNVGSDQAIEIRELAALIAGEFGSFVDFPELSEGAVDRYIPSILKAKDELGLLLKYDLLSSIRETIRRIK
jgi:dTDP-glucose 4,6-dehydratase